MIRRKPIRHDIPALLPVLAAKLSEDPAVVFAYVFGSYGKGTPKPLSDVDIAVFLDLAKVTKLSDKKLKLIGLATEALKTDEVDVVILNRAPLTLQHQVIKTGRVLMSRDDSLRLDFERRTLLVYLDAEPLRRSAWDALVKRIEEGRYGR